MLKKNKINIAVLLLWVETIGGFAETKYRKLWWRQTENVVKERSTMCNKINNKMTIIVRRLRAIIRHSVLCKMDLLLKFVVAAIKKEQRLLQLTLCLIHWSLTEPPEIFPINYSSPDLSLLPQLWLLSNSPDLLSDYISNGSQFWQQPREAFLFLSTFTSIKMVLFMSRQIKIKQISFNLVIYPPVLMYKAEWGNNTWHCRDLSLLID